MSCNIIITQQASSLFSDKVNSEAKLKDSKRQERGKKSHEAYMKRFRDIFLKDNHIVQMTLCYSGQGEGKKPPPPTSFPPVASINFYRLLVLNLFATLV